MKERLSMKQVTPLLKGFIFFVGVSLLLACSSDNDNPPPPEPAPDPQPKPEPDPDVKPSRGNKEVSKALQEGSAWKTECAPFKEGSGMVVWSFTLTDFSTKYDVYSDSACTNKDSERSSEFSGTYDVGSNQITSPEGYKAYELDVNFSDGGSLPSLIALSEDKEKILITVDETRPTDFSKAFEYSKEESEDGEDTPIDLEGKWISVCIELEQEKSFGIDFDVKGDQFTWDEINFTDASCKNQDSKKSFQGTLVLGEQVTTDEGEVATELDLDFKKAVDQKRIYVKDKTESGRDVLILSVHDKGTGSRPTNLKGGLAFGKLDAGKSTAKSGTLVPDFMGNNEELGHFSTPSMSLELNQGLKEDADISGNLNGDFMQKSHEMDDLLLNQEGLRSGNW